MHSRQSNPCKYSWRMEFTCLASGGWATMCRVESAWENLQAITRPVSMLVATMHPGAAGGGLGFRRTGNVLHVDMPKNTAGGSCLSGGSFWCLTSAFIVICRGLVKRASWSEPGMVGVVGRGSISNKQGDSHLCCCTQRQATNLGTALFSMIVQFICLADGTSMGAGGGGHKCPHSSRSGANYGKISNPEVTPPPHPPHSCWGCSKAQLRRSYPHPHFHGRQTPEQARHPRLHQPPPPPP